MVRGWRSTGTRPSEEPFRNAERKYRQKTQRENADKKHRENPNRKHREKTQRENTETENTKRKHKEKTQRENTDKKNREKTQTENTERKHTQKTHRKHREKTRRENTETENTEAENTERKHRENTDRKHREKTHTENTDRKHRKKTQKENTETENTECKVLHSTPRQSRESSPGPLAFKANALSSRPYSKDCDSKYNAQSYRADTKHKRSHAQGNARSNFKPPKFASRHSFAWSTIRQNQNVRFATAACHQKFPDACFTTAACAKMYETSEGCPRHLAAYKNYHFTTVSDV